MLAFDWLEHTDKIGCNIFPCENNLCRAMLPDCLGTLSSTLCQISALKGAIGLNVYDISIFLKWGILNVPFCSIFVPFHFYLVMTLVVPCLDNIFMVCWSLNLQKLVQRNLFFWILVSLGGEGGGCVCVGMVCYYCIAHLINSRKNTIYFQRQCLSQRFVQSYAAKLLEDIFLYFVPN